MADSNFIREFKDAAILRIRENTPRIHKCLNLINEEEAWRKPNESSNSIANLILHLNGNISQYIISSLGMQKDIRNRDLEFSTNHSQNKGELYQIIFNTCESSCDVIQNCSEKELLRKRLVQGFELSGIGIITHVVEHYSYHTGQIALITKMIKNQDLGFYADFDLNIKNN